MLARNFPSEKYSSQLLEIRMTGIPTSSTLILLSAVLVGVAKTGVSGAGVLVVPLMAMALPAKESVGALLPMLIVGDVAAVLYYRRHAQWGRLLRLFPGVAVGMTAGGVLLSYIDNASMKTLLGVLVLVLLSLEFVARNTSSAIYREMTSFAVVIGFLAGFATTVGNAAGPIMGIYLIMMGLTKEQLMGTGAWFYLLVNTTKAPIFIIQGMLTLSELQHLLYLLPMVVLGTVMGRKLLMILSQQVFERAVLGFAALTAVSLILG